MTAVLWGLLASFGWGTADFIVRFSGRQVGHTRALLGTFLVGAVLLTLLVLVVGDVTLEWSSDLLLVLLSGFAATISTLLLYAALVRGPLTVVAPIGGSYPAFIVAFSYVVGVRPSALQWAAMAVVMGGTTLLALTEPGEGELDPTLELERRRPYVRMSALVALGASVLSAVNVAAGQEAALVYGPVVTVWLGRLIGLPLLLGLLAVRRESARIPRSVWPLLGAQGVLDTTAFLAVLAGSEGTGRAITVVVASTFSAVTVLLAWAVLRERLSPARWAGVLAVVAGVAALSA